jgi:protein TonB
MQHADPVALPDNRMRHRWEYAGLDHPFELVWGLERTRAGHVVLALLLALLFHGALAAKGAFGLYEVGDFARAAQALVQEQMNRVVAVSMIRPDPEPEPPPTARSEPEAPPLERTPVPRQRSREAAPAAARAARVLTAEPDPDEPLDLTGNTFVQGNADTYAGGVTARSGTSSTAVRDLGARGDGVVGGRGKGPAADLSRAARPLEEEWNCPFPPEADVEQINFKRVQVVVKVGTAGKALDVTVVSDPGYGFGMAAKRCAMRQRYEPALGRDGKPVVGTARSFFVRFSR